MTDEQGVDLLRRGQVSVVHVHPRRFPALAVQGDTLFTWFDEIDRAIRAGDSADELADLRDRLELVLTMYEQVLSENGFPVPYVRRA